MKNTNSSGSAYAVKTAEAEKTQKISVKNPQFNRLTLSKL